MITLVIEALYAIVFLRSLTTYLRRRDPIQRDLTLVFAPFTSLLVLEVVRLVQGVNALPVVPSYVAVTLLLAQPYLTLRLVRTLRPVPRWVMRMAFGIFVVTTVPFYFLGQRNIPVVTLAVVAGFFVVQALAAVLLAGEARRRTGAPRARLNLAAAATVVLGLCLLIAGAGGSAGRAGHAAQIAAQVTALLSGVSYVVAFMPPRWLRRVAAGNAAYQVHHQMISALDDEAPSDTWRRFARTVREVSGAASALVLLPTETGMRCVAGSGDSRIENLTTSASDTERLLSMPQPVAVPADSASPLMIQAHRAGARVVVAVPLQLPTSARGALVLLSHRFPMFVEDDARLLGELGVQAAIIAERQAAAEAVRTANAQLEQRVHERTADLAAARAALEDVNAQLQVQNTMLTRSNEELQRFAYVASHDLQEPLRKIISFSGLLVERMPDNLEPDTRMHVDRIVASATRMQRLIEDLLIYSRAGGAVERTPVDCGQALQSVLDSMTVALVQSSATVTVEPLPNVMANPTPIEQLFQNLIGNALKYRSAAPPHIHVAADQVDGMWRLTISDNGIGIDMAFAERIFHVFQRLHPRGQYEGTGIGLAVCKRIVESYGGRIGVESTPGDGSKFWFTLPGTDPDLTIQEATYAVAHNPA